MRKLDPRKLTCLLPPLFALLVMVPGAQAVPFSVNDRPVTLEPGPEVALVKLVADAGYRGDYTQSTNALFSAVGDRVDAKIVVEYAGFAPNNSLGIYNLKGEEVLLFSGADGANAITTLVFDGSSLIIDGAEHGEFAAFGFFLENSKNDGGFEWFSQDILNADDGFAHFMAFEEAELGLNSLYFGFEDLARSHTDYDYNDMVVKVTSVRGAAPMPESTGALAFAVGMMVICSGIGRFATGR